ncbi:MAG: family 20 glycosylhydrolase [Polyangiaceae bacterium]|nr:family 20 glycosylhydrolase [Polyangiaceae bacterium]
MRHLMSCLFGFFISQNHRAILRIFSGIFFIAFLSSCGASHSIPKANPPSSATPHQWSGDDFAIVPRPREVLPGQGVFRLDAETSLVFPVNDEPLKSLASDLAVSLGESLGRPLKSPESDSLVQEPKIELSLVDSIDSPEAYELLIRPEGVGLSASTPQGLFYGIQTLLQIVEKTEPSAEGSLLLPAGEIRDRPRFSYRGLHLDVGRHFFSPEEVKRYIDLMARYKFNVFHWHLTEDQGWRIEIKKYPRLTEVGAFRKETLIGHDRDRPHRFDGVRYGGFYTQEQVREIVAYAQARYIEVIPEIEMPGHALAALAAYPELACRQQDGQPSGPFEVATEWGIFQDVYCPKEETFLFLENVLAEVLELFPSRKIHVGGDEVPKEKWESSPEAQAIMAREGLETSDELQSYFMRRIQAYLQSQGREMIGWDEILEGGLAPGATVMSWRGESGGVEAAKLDHPVIMTPNHSLYFNTYQSLDFEAEPIAGARYLPLKKVYSYEPIPAELSDEQAENILGAQGCLWTEYISDEEQLQYMAYPRALALAEVVWSAKQDRDWNDFTRRLPAEFKILRKKGVAFGSHFYEVQQEAALGDNQTLVVELSAPGDVEIHWTKDGSEPTSASPVYTAPLQLSEETTIRASAYQGELRLFRPTEGEYYVHRALGLPGSFVAQPNARYLSTGAGALTDGRRGSTTFGDGRWLGFLGDSFEVTYELGDELSLKSCRMTFLSSPSDWILPPQKVEVWLSADNKSYDLAATQELLSLSDYEPANIRELNLPLVNKKARYVRLRAVNGGPLPAWHSGAGKDAWLFVDEVILQ